MTLDGDAQEDAKFFTNLGSIVDKQGGTDTDATVRISKARAAYLQMKNTGLLNTTVKPELLYGAEIWRTTAATLKKIQMFINTYFRR